MRQERKKILIHKILYKASENLINHDGIEHAGYMSFMILFSLFPFLIFFLTLTYLLGAHHIGQNLIYAIIVNLPINLSEVLIDQIKQIYLLPPNSVLNIAIIGLIWTSSSFIESIRTILNRIYQISNPPSYLWRRFLSIIQFFFLNLLLFTITVFWLMLTIFSGTFLGLRQILNESYYYASSISMTAVLFILVTGFYYIIPNKKIHLKEVLPGSVTTVFLWIVFGKFLSKYINYYAQLNFVYGSLASVIVVLLFFYIVSLIFIYGAELNYLIFRYNLDLNQIKTQI